MTSLSSTQGATDLVKSAQATLATANLRLHKVVSNSVEVMEAFPAEDRAKDVRDLDLRHDSLPAQRSLGVFWDLETDAFTFKVSLPEKPFTRRGVLSIVNSVYDPLGFVELELGDLRSNIDVFRAVLSFSELRNVGVCLALKTGSDVSFSLLYLVFVFLLILLLL